MSSQILLASNNSPVISLITNELRYEGYQLKIVEDGVSALLTIREQQPDLAILDFALSRPSALEICRRLHATQQEMPIRLLQNLESLS